MTVASPLIELRDASVEIPIYNSRGRSLKNLLLKKVGGKVTTDDRSVVTVKALDRISLTLRPGDRLGVLGHNGAGKSSLLRVLSGAYEPSSGTADIQGSRSSLLDMTMGMDPEFSGVDNIFLRGAFIGMSQKEVRRIIPEIAEFSELGSYIDLPMRTYSSGMSLRLAFAICTAQVPDILLLDELISVGDESFALKARNRIEALIQNSKILVLASHSIETLRNYCNRAILLHEGSMVADGPLEEIIETQKSRAMQS